ncbi:aldo/keto reductase [soil metagenome]
MNNISYRQMGSSDLRVSSVGLGCNAFGMRIDLDQTKTVVSAALDAGITLFDTADVYGFGVSEEMLGEALGTRRADVLVATKFGMDLNGLNGDDGGRRGSAAYVKTAVEASLKRLGTDYIDLFQLHTPDPLTPIAETLGALDELVSKGTVRYIGCSNMTAWQVVDAQWTADTEGLTSFVSAQNEYSLYNRSAEPELTPACERFGIGILPYFPLAYGLLTGKYRRGEVPPAGSRLAASAQAARLAAADWDRIEALESYARDRGVSILDVAIGGLAAQPAVASVISGATRPEQVLANVAAGSWQPTADDLAALNEITADPTAMSYVTYAPK